MSSQQLNIPSDNEDQGESGSDGFKTPPTSLPGSPLPSPNQEQIPFLTADPTSAAICKAIVEQAHVNTQPFAAKGAAETLSLRRDFKKSQPASTSKNVAKTTNPDVPLLFSEAETLSSENEGVSVCNKSDASVTCTGSDVLSSSDEGLLSEAAGGEPVVRDSSSTLLSGTLSVAIPSDGCSKGGHHGTYTSSDLHSSSDEGLLSEAAGGEPAPVGRNPSTSPPPGTLSVAIPSDVMTGEESLPSSPAPDHLSPVIQSDSTSSGKISVGNVKHAEESKKPKRNRDKKSHRLDEGNESTTAASSAEPPSKYKKDPKQKPGKNGRGRWKKRAIAFLKKDKDAPAADYKDSSSSSDNWQMTSGMQSSSSDSVLDASPGQFVSALTLHRSSLNDGVHIQSQLVLPQGSVSYEDMTAEEILKKLGEIAETQPVHVALRQTLLTKTLPRAERVQDFRSVASCLKSRDSLLCTRAGQTLERMFFTDRPIRIPPSDILKIMKLTWAAIDNNSHVIEDMISRHCNLLLLEACALLCLQDRPSADSLQEELENSIQQELKAFIKSSDQNKSCKAYRVLKGTDAFFKDFLAAIKSRVTYHEIDWEHVLTSGTNGKRERERKLTKANFAQLLLTIYSLSKEIVQKAWDRLLDDLLAELQRAQRAVVKQRMNDEDRATFDFFLVRCLYIVINTTFKEDRQEVGERLYKAAGKTASVLCTAVKNASSKHQSMLLDEIHRLPFHPSQQVRKEMRELVKLFSLEMCELSVSYAETRLQVADLRTTPGQEEEGPQERKQRECSWQERGWRRADGSLLQGAMCVPTRRCLATGSAEGCVDHAVPTQRSQQHERHLEMLIRLGPHQNLLRLLAFQHRPRPCFYITENVKQQQLTALLIDKRTEQHWLSHTVLLQAAQHIAKALAFLAKKGIALRNVTTFNMIYEKTEDRHGKVKDILVKLADLGLADEYLDRGSGDGAYENRDIRTQRDPGPIPVRWISWEALFLSRFSPQSMVYAFGWVLYELFTHGCQPFTEMSRRTTDDILQLFFRQSQSVRVFHWPCLPLEVYKIIRQCTEYKTTERPAIEELEGKIKTLLQELDSCCAERDVPIMQSIRNKNEGYPPISLEQRERKHEPEKGIPPIVLQLLKGDPNRYKNLRLSGWQTSSTVLATDAELCPQDSIRIMPGSPGGPTIVEEDLTREFVRNVLPDVESGRTSLQGVADWITEPILTPDTCSQYLQVRQYQRSVTLLEAVIRIMQLCELGVYDVYLNVSGVGHAILHVFLLLARVVNLLHSQGWLHCDLRASNVLITYDDCKVTLARIGRMVKLSPGAKAVYRPTIHKDSTRWSAPEVLHMNISSKESDVFMLGTLFWEVFNARDKCFKDPTAEGDPKSLVPFADARISDIANMVQEGVLLPAPPECLCPPWLYQLICDCRNPDCTARPSISDIVNCLELRCTSNDSTKLKELLTSRSDGTLLLGQNNNSEVPHLPPRSSLFQTIRRNFKRTLSFRAGKQTKRKSEVSSPSTGQFTAAVVEPEPKKTFIKRFLPKKNRAANKGEFYELGYFATGSSDGQMVDRDHRSGYLAAVTRPRPESGSEVYDEIDSEAMYSDCDRTAKPMGPRKPPLLGRSPLTELTNQQSSLAQSRSPPKTISSGKSNLQSAKPPEHSVSTSTQLQPWGLPQAKTALRVTSSGIPESTPRVKICEASDETYESMDSAPSFPPPPVPTRPLTTQPKSKGTDGRGLRIQASNSSPERDSVTMTEQYFDPALDPRMTTPPSARGPVVVHTLQGRLHSKPLPVPDSDTDDEHVRCRFEETVLRKTPQDDKLLHLHDVTHNKYRPVKDSTNISHAMESISHTARDMLNSRNSPLSSRQSDLSKPASTAPGRILSQRPAMPLPKSAILQNDQEKLSGIYTEPDVSSSSIGKPGQRFNGNNSQMEVYDDSIGAANKARPNDVALTLDKQDDGPCELYDDCAEKVQEHHEYGENKPPPFTEYVIPSEIYDDRNEAGSPGTSLEIYDDCDEARPPCTSLEIYDDCDEARPPCTSLEIYDDCVEARSPGTSLEIYDDCVEGGSSGAPFEIYDDRNEAGSPGTSLEIYDDCVEARSPGASLEIYDDCVEGASLETYDCNETGPLSAEFYHEEQEETYEAMEVLTADTQKTHGIMLSHSSTVVTTQASNPNNTFTVPAGDESNAPVSSSVIVPGTLRTSQQNVNPNSHNTPPKRCGSSRPNPSQTQLRDSNQNRDSPGLREAPEANVAASFSGYLEVFPDTDRTQSLESSPNNTNSTYLTPIYVKSFQPKK